MAKLGQLEIWILVLCTLEGALAAFNYSSDGEDWARVTQNGLHLFAFRLTQCRNGQKQSPINIVLANVKKAGSTSSFVLSYVDSMEVVVLNTGHAVEVEPAEGTTNQLETPDGEVWSLIQFHWHAYSEHAIDGLFGALEGHFVHTNVRNKSRIAVVGVIYKLDPLNKANKILNTILPSAPHTVSNLTVKVTVNPRSFLTKSAASSALDFYTYEGSLTTPSCNQTVQWYVLQKFQTVSVDQVELFQSAISAVSDGERENNRPPEPLHGRVVTSYSVKKQQKKF
eukprot:SM000073S21429  [mRNA]  locus=s73:254997:256731:+ [translate_table: standard]